MPPPPLPSTLPWTFDPHFDVLLHVIVVSSRLPHSETSCHPNTGAVPVPSTGQFAAVNVFTSRAGLDAS
jgi:hypothetical protein